MQIAKLQDDNRALDRLTKSKEAALLDAERTVQIALAKASMVDDLQNKNQELMKQIEICQVFRYIMCYFYCSDHGFKVCYVDNEVHATFFCLAYLSFYHRKKTRFWTKCTAKRLQRLRSLARLYES